MYFSEGRGGGFFFNVTRWEGAYIFFADERGLTFPDPSPSSIKSPLPYYNWCSKFTKKIQWRYLTSLGEPFFLSCHSFARPGNSMQIISHTTIWWECLTKEWHHKKNKRLSIATSASWLNQMFFKFHFFFLQIFCFYITTI